MKKKYKESNINKDINNSLKYKTPDIILDNYQDIKHINKVQPLGWNKQGIWVGISKNKKTRKKIITTIPSTLKFMYNDNTCTIYTEE